MREGRGSGAASAQVVVIKAGMGNAEDAHFYSPECLQDSVNRGLWNGAQCFIDHPTAVEDKVIPERLVEKLAGYFSDAKMATVGGVPAIVATFTPEIGNERVLQKLRTAMQYSRQYPDAAYVGFSINAMGEGSPAQFGGRAVNKVDKITKVVSVDIVTRAGAGGKLLSLQESYKEARRFTRAAIAPRRRPAVRLRESDAPRTLKLDCFGLDF